MIGLMPRYIPRPPKRRLPFSRSRKRRLPASAGTFEQVAEFPLATVRPRHGGQLQYAIGAFTRWLLARWQWFKPRTIPVIVATLGMVGIVALSDYLAHHIDQKAPVSKLSRK